MKTSEGTERTFAAIQHDLFGSTFDSVFGRPAPRDNKSKPEKLNPARKALSDILLQLSDLDDDAPAWQVAGTLKRVRELAVKGLKR